MGDEHIAGLTGEGTRRASVRKRLRSNQDPEELMTVSSLVSQLNS